MNMLYNRNIDELDAWIQSDSSEIHRLLITHTDLDGYGCEVMVRGMLRYNHSHSKSPLTVYHVNPGTDNIAVAGYVNNSSHGYTKGDDMLFILITDLGSINLDFYSNMVETGHKIQLIVVDHHQTTFKDSKNSDGIATPLVLTFFHDTHVSSTMQLFDLWSNVASDVRFPDDITYSNYYSYARDVSIYDTGKWSDDWDTDRFIDIFKNAPEVYEQLNFIAYRNHNLMDKYVSDTLDLFGLPDFHPSIDPAYVHDAWVTLNKEYKKFSVDMISMNNGYTKPVLFTYNDQCPAYILVPTVYGVTVNSKDEDYKFFSLISRKILDTKPDIDILVLVNNFRNTVELRTSKDHINLAEIAKLNGGGGHPKAAGFPIPKLKG